MVKNYFFLKVIEKNKVLFQAIRIIAWPSASRHLASWRSVREDNGGYQGLFFYWLYWIGYPDFSYEYAQVLNRLNQLKVVKFGGTNLWLNRLNLINWGYRLIGLSVLSLRNSVIFYAFRGLFQIRWVTQFFTHCHWTKCFLFILQVVLEQNIIPTAYIIIRL